MFPVSYELKFESVKKNRVKMDIVIVVSLLLVFTIYMIIGVFGIILFGDELEDNISVKAFPNPATEYIEINSEINEFEVKVYDLTGQEILQKQTVTGSVIINKQNLTSGT